MRKKLIKNTVSPDLNSTTTKPEISHIPFEDEHIEGERHFKLRAECLDDVFLLILKIPQNVWGIKIGKMGPLPDYEFEFKTHLTSDEIIAILLKQVDSHVMIDTLKPIDEYTGERYYLQGSLKRSIDVPKQK